APRVRPRSSSIARSSSSRSSSRRAITTRARADRGRETHPSSAPRRKSEARRAADEAMTEALPKFELLLREALAPVEPPADLVERVESALQAITEMAADELEAWELSAMRDPRNWVRPAAALVLGGTAGTALVLLRARRRSR